MPSSARLAKFDEKTGLRHFRARLCENELLRFYAIDSAGEFDSPYIFTGNSVENQMRNEQFF
jgi:uncharacterized protein YfaP (DUF2135 family)